MTAATRLYLSQEILGFHHAYHYCDARSVMFRLYRLVDGRFEIESDVQPLDEDESRGDRESETIFVATDEGSAIRYLSEFVAQIKSDVDDRLARPDPEDVAYDRLIELAEMRGCGDWTIETDSDLVPA